MLVDTRNAGTKLSLGRARLAPDANATPTTTTTNADGGVGAIRTYTRGIEEPTGPATVVVTARRWQKAKFHEQWANGQAMFYYVGHRDDQVDVMSSSVLGGTPTTVVSIPQVAAILAGKHAKATTKQRPKPLTKTGDAYLKTLLKNDDLTRVGLIMSILHEIVLHLQYAIEDALSGRAQSLPGPIVVNVTTTPLDMIDHIVSIERSASPKITLETYNAARRSLEFVRRFAVYTAELYRRASALTTANLKTTTPLITWDIIDGVMQQWEAESLKLDTTKFTPKPFSLPELPDADRAYMLEDFDSVASSLRYVGIFSSVLPKENGICDVELFVSGNTRCKNYWGEGIARGTHVGFVFKRLVAQGPIVPVPWTSTRGRVPSNEEMRSKLLGDLTEPGEFVYVGVVVEEDEVARTAEYPRNHNNRQWLTTSTARSEHPMCAVGLYEGVPDTERAARDARGQRDMIVVHLGTSNWRPVRNRAELAPISRVEHFVQIGMDL